MVTALAVALVASCTTEPGPDDGPGTQPGDCSIAPSLVGPGFHVAGISNSGTDLLVFDNNLDGDAGADVVHIDAQTLQRRVIHSFDPTTDDYSINGVKISPDGERYLLQYWSSTIQGSEIFGQITVGAIDGSWQYSIPLPYEYADFYANPDLSIVGLRLYSTSPTDPSPLYHVSADGITNTTFNLEGPASYRLRGLSDDMSQALWQGWGFSPLYGFLVVTDTETGTVIAERNNFPIAQSRLSAFFQSNGNVVINTGRPQAPEGEFMGADSFVWNLTNDSITPFDTGYETASIQWLSVDHQRMIYATQPGYELHHRSPTADRFFTRDSRATWSQDGTAGASTDGEFVYVHCLAAD